MSSPYLTARRPSLAIAALSDAFLALSLTLRTSRRRLLVSWVYTPAGILLMLLACWGVDSVIRLTGVSFPASVAGMVLLFAGLVGCRAVLGERRTRRVVGVVDVPTGFALRYINVFFTPSFILLPLSPRIGGVEIGKIIAIFIIGFVVMLVITAYMVQALQALFHTSKPEHTSSESTSGSIPLTNTPAPPAQSTNTSTTTTPQASLPTLPPPQPAAEPTHLRGPGPQCAFAAQTPALLSILRQEGAPLARAQRWAAFLTTHLDTAVYSLLLLVGVVVFYTTSYAMPLHLALNVLTYTLSLSLPAKARRILHPVLTTSLLTLLLLTLLSLTAHQPLAATLKTYSTSTRYLTLFRNHPHPLPGAGDIFASLLDASIVSLALPMYAQRATLHTHLPSILLPSTTLAAATLFAYPTLCHLLGLAPTRSLAFGARSLTLALALPAVGNLGGDANLVAVLCIMSGIVGVLVGGGVLRVVGVKRGDYVTRGVAMGVNGGAIATAALVGGGDVRGAALGGVAMVVFGVAVVGLTAVPVVVGALKGLVGL